MADPDPIVLQLTEERILRGLSQREVAALAGVGQSMVSEWESGAVPPRVKSLRRHAAALGYRLSIALEPADGSVVPGVPPESREPGDGYRGPEADGLEAILDAALTIWGPDYMSLSDMVVSAVKVLGDLAGPARDQNEVGRAPDPADLRRGLGNLIVSSVRWAHLLGLDPDECVRDALAAQAAYVERRGGRHG